MAQLNIRLNREVKAAGESAIADMGVSVSDFVRQLWERLSGSDEERAAIEQAVLGTSASHQEDASLVVERQRRLDALARAGMLRDGWMQSVGIGEEALLEGAPSIDDDDGVDQFIPQRPGQRHSLRFIDKTCEEDVILLYPACER